ncbi:unnamed protein product [Schistosoma turkestanicum]|nr:unnamed protein product [Schistosoma turkestanicum]
MDPFLDAFFAVDLDRDEKISMRDLKNYVERNNLDEKMIENWGNLFDPENTGYITLGKFCDVLGVRMEDARKVRDEFINRSSNLLPADISVISHQMNINDQKQISDQARSLLSPPNQLDNKEIAHRLKLWLHKTYGPTWHVVVLRGAYGTSYTHLENRSFQFRLRDRCFLIWGTPDKLQSI